MKRKNHRLADRAIQPTVYTLLYQRVTGGALPPAFEYHLIVPNKTMVHVPLTTKRDERDVQILLRYIEAFMEDLRTGNFRPADPDHWICNPEYCGYYETCKYARR